MIKNNDTIVSLASKSEQRVMRIDLNLWRKSYALANQLFFAAFQ